MRVAYETKRRVKPPGLWGLDKTRAPKVRGCKKNWREDHIWMACTSLRLRTKGISGELRTFEKDSKGALKGGVPKGDSRNKNRK